MSTSPPESSFPVPLPNHYPQRRKSTAAEALDPVLPESAGRWVLSTALLIQESGSAAGGWTWHADPVLFEAAWRFLPVLFEAAERLPPVPVFFLHQAVSLHVFLDYIMKFLKNGQSLKQLSIFFMGTQNMIQQKP